MRARDPASVISRKQLLHGKSCSESNSVVAPRNWGGLARWVCKLCASECPGTSAPAGGRGKQGKPPGAPSGRTTTVTVTVVRLGILWLVKGGMGTS